MKKNLKTVEYWNTITAESPDHQVGQTALSYVMDQAAKVRFYGDTPSDDYIFQNIWIPVLEKDANHQTLSTYIYYNVGIPSYEIANAYEALYGGNLLIEPWEAGEAVVGESKLIERIKAVINLNMGKYLKIIEELGFEYNPLWNVDGTELYQSVDTHGNIVRTSTPIVATSQELQTAPYDNGLRTQNKTINTYSGTQETTNETHSPIIEDGVSGIVHDVANGDESHIEKRVRQGNIGTVSTVKLLEEQREYVKFSLIREFFNDINEVILIGVWD